MFGINFGQTVTVGWLLAVSAIVVVLHLLISRSGHLGETTVERLDHSAAQLVKALGDEKTLLRLQGISRSLERVSGRFSLLERSANFSAACLTAIGVALGLIGSGFADWVVRGGGRAWFFQAAVDGTDRDLAGQVVRGLQVAGLGLLVAVVVGFVLVPWVDRMLRDRQARRLAGEVAAMNQLLDRALQLTRSGPHGGPA